MSGPAPVPRIAVVGAGSLIGEALIAELDARAVPRARLFALEESRTLGRLADRGGGEESIGDVDTFDFGDVDLAFFCSHAASARRYAAAAAAHALVIDGTSAHRDDPAVPLVVADVNPHILDGFGPRGLIALPGSASAALATALAPLAALAGLERVDVATYHAVSGAGRAGVDGLAADTIALLGGQASRGRPFGAQIGFNVLPFVGSAGPDGVCAEERRLIEETRRVLGLPEFEIGATAVRVPVFFGHGLAAHVRLARPFTLADAAEALRQGAGLRLIEARPGEPAPTPAAAALAPDRVYVGRLRIDSSRDRSLNFWVVADNVRKCAAHNAVSVAQILVNRAR